MYFCYMIIKPQVVKSRVNSQNHRPAPQIMQTIIPNEVLYIQKRNTLLPKNALVINLPKSTERLAYFNEHNSFNGVTEVIEAVDGLTLPKVPEGVPLRQGSLGCLLSHKKALEYAKEKGYPCVIVFEDDADLRPTFNEDLKAAMLELPESWDLLWLAGMDAIGSPSYPYSEHLKRLNGSWGTFGYVIHSNVYDYFIDVFSEQKRSSDDYFRINHPRFASFRTAQSIIGHKGSKSDRTEIDRLGKL